MLDDEKHRAKHNDLNRESTGIFSSESEIYNETHHHFSSSSKNEGKKIMICVCCFHHFLFCNKNDFSN